MSSVLNAAYQRRTHMACAPFNHRSTTSSRIMHPMSQSMFHKHHVSWLLCTPTDRTVPSTQSSRAPLWCRFEQGVHSRTTLREMLLSSVKSPYPVVLDWCRSNWAARGSNLGGNLDCAQQHHSSWDRVSCGLRLRKTFSSRRQSIVY